MDDATRDACDALVPRGSAVANFHNTAYWMKTTIPDTDAPEGPVALESTRPESRR